jgi:catechol 2,3-dioxygenase-like lactoylglutathione lyase family enzyme
MAEAIDRRPPVWTGHVILPSADVAAAARFYEQIGMRPVTVKEHFAALELRGGTHLVIHHDSQQVVGSTSWDLMVEDIDVTHDKWQAEGLHVTDIVKDDQSPHRRFEVTDPDGHVLVVRDTHVVGPV